MKKTILSLFILVLLTACNSPQEEKASTILDTKISTIKAAQNSVNAVNARTNIINLQTHIQKTSASGESLYSAKCASCHGKNAEKSALNASASIAGWSSNKVREALIGYKNGGFGGKMKGIMQGQIKPLSQAEIKLLSDYISVL